LIFRVPSQERSMRGMSRELATAAITFRGVRARRTDSVHGLLSFSGAVWKVGVRDQWIGWSHEQREQRLHLIVNVSVR
jgi:Druantia protein DruA